MFRPTVARALLPDLTLHDLRHRFASALIPRGQSMKYVQTVRPTQRLRRRGTSTATLFDTGGHGGGRRLETWLAHEDDPLHSVHRASA